MRSAGISKVLPIALLGERAYVFHNKLLQPQAGGQPLEFGVEAYFR